VEIGVIVTQTLGGFEEHGLDVAQRRRRSFEFRQVGEAGIEMVQSCAQRVERGGFEVFQVAGLPVPHYGLVGGAVSGIGTLRKLAGQAGAGAAILM
jgi:hypothetical protein